VRYFNGAIADKTLSDFQQFDVEIDKYSDRLNYVNSLINNEDGLVHDFFSTYFDEYYDASPSRDGYMSDQDAVCKTLESLGTYLLNAKDIKSNRKIKYRFWKSEREFKQYKESQNINTSTFETSLEEDSDVEVIDMFYSPQDKNYKVSIDQKIYKQDIKDIKEINQLQKTIEYAKTNEFKDKIIKKIDEILPLISNERDIVRLKRIKGNINYYIKQFIRSLKDNQLAIKIEIKRPFMFQNTNEDGVKNKLLNTAIDFSDEKVNKVLLEMIGERESLMTDVGIMIYDFNCLLDEIDFTEREQSIIDLFRKGHRRKELPSLLKIKSNTVSDTINRIAKKVAKHYVKQLYYYALYNRFKNKKK